MLDVHRLVMLREVYLRGSITAAAKALSYTHSAVSQQLSLLEKEAGIQLLERVGRSVRLTPAAEELVGHATDILAILEKAQSDLAAADTEVRGTLRLAGFATISRTAVPNVIGRLRRQHPSLDVRYWQVQPEDGFLLLTSRRIDVLVTDSYPGSPQAIPVDLHAHLLIRDPIRAYFPRGAALDTIDDFRRVQWSMEPPGTEAHTWVRQACRRHGFEPNAAYESADLLFHLRMVEAGLAAAFLPDLVVREADTQLRPSTTLGVPQDRHISLICRAGAERRPAVVACRNSFAEVVAAGPGQL